ncbi:hypothetical protein PVAP13_9NG744177 [Panicum virgatum]|uniref:Uncharacterized protein n=1 Tax=Panicum virgatum TaxID=38727 RepID=A0A8T0N2I2_PANVG|nr:hypothetical protein PVAP13_9NG744177 [Panicum virgatum]
MKLDSGVHIAMHSILSLKPGVTIAHLPPRLRSSASQPSSSTATLAASPPPCFLAPTLSSTGTSSTGCGRRVPPPADQAERHGSAAVLVGHDGGEQGRHPDARQLHRGAHHVHVGPGRARGGDQRVPLLPAHVPPLRALRRHARAAAAREHRRRDAAVRRRLRDGRRAAAPRHVPLLRAAGDGRARPARERREVRPQLAQAHPLRRRAARQGCHGSRGQGLPGRRRCPGIRYDRDMWGHIARESRKGKIKLVNLDRLEHLSHKLKQRSLTSRHWNICHRFN